MEISISYKYTDNINFLNYKFAIRDNSTYKYLVALENSIIFS